MSVPPCPRPLQRRPWVITGGGWGLEEGLDFKYWRELYLFLSWSFIRKEGLSGNGLFTRLEKS